MTNQRALKTAIQCMKSEMQRLAVNASMHDMYHMDIPCAVNASRRRVKIRGAIAVLEQILMELMAQESEYAGEET